MASKKELEERVKELEEENEYLRDQVFEQECRIDEREWERDDDDDQPKFPGAGLSTGEYVKQYNRMRNFK